MSVELFDNPSANDLGKGTEHNKEKNKDNEENDFVKSLRKRVKELLKEPENLRCSECWSKKNKPRYMAIIRAPIEGTNKVGVFCCKRCHVYLNSLGEDYCTVKSLKTPEEWTEKDVETLEKSGNKAVNAIYLSSLQGNHTEKHMGSLASASYVDSKYKQCLFFSTDAYHEQMNLRAMMQFAKDPKPVEPPKPTQQDKLRSALSRQKSSYGEWGRGTKGGGTRNLNVGLSTGSTDSAVEAIRKENQEESNNSTDNEKGEEGDVPFMGWGGNKSGDSDPEKEGNSADDVPFKGWGNKKEEGTSDGDVPFKGWGGGDDKGEDGDQKETENKEDDTTRPSRKSPSRIGRRTPMRSRSFQPEDADRLRSSRSTSRPRNASNSPFRDSQRSTSPFRDSRNSNDAPQLARPRMVQRGISAPAEQATAASSSRPKPSRPRTLDARSRSTSTGGGRSHSRSRSPVRPKRPSPTSSPANSPVRKSGSRNNGMRRVMSYDRSTAKGRSKSPARGAGGERNSNWTSNSLSPKRSLPINPSRKSTSVHSSSRRKPKMQDDLEDSSDSSVSISESDASLFGDTSDSDESSIGGGDDNESRCRKPLDVVSRAMQALHAKNTGVVKTAIELQAMSRSESPPKDRNIGASGSSSSSSRENYQRKLQSIQDLGKEQAWELLQKTAAAGSAKANARTNSESSHQRRQMVLDAVSKNKPIPDLLAQKRNGTTSSQSKLPALLEGTRPGLARSNSAPSVSSSSAGGTMSGSERFSFAETEPFQMRHRMATGDFTSGSTHLNMLAKSCFQGFTEAQATSNQLLQDDSLS